MEWTSARLSLSAGTVWAVMTVVCAWRSDAAGAEDQTKDGTAASGPVADQPLAEYQGELLSLAFRAASLPPTNPHAKNRARMQEEVVTTCFELAQPQRALRCIEQIEQWRRGVGYADFAFYCVKHGEPAQAESWLEKARQVAQSVNGDDAQDWQRDRILARIAGTYVLMGQPQKAAEAMSGIAVDEASRIEAVKAMVADADDFDARMKSVDDAVAQRSLDQARHALEACVELFGRFHGDADRRARAREKVESASKALPVQIRIELHSELARVALEKDDRAEALELVNAAQRLLSDTRWLPEDRIPLVARLAQQRYRAGEKEAARKQVDEALAQFDAARETIVNIARAGVLRSVAESYSGMQDGVAALAVYKRAVEEGIVNPNSRPRADDLIATCLSLATHRVEPDSSLRTRLFEILDGLGDPW